MPPTIDALTIADEPDAWRSAGFTVDDDGTCRIGMVRVELVGATSAEAGGTRGIRTWSLRDLPPKASAADNLDGVTTHPSTRPPADPAEHPNGTIRIDHVVIASADGQATSQAFEAVGWDQRRLREAGNETASMHQRFFRAGEVILEVVAPHMPAAPTKRHTTKLFGLAFVVADLDATVATLEAVCNPPKGAVQPGKRIATLRTRDLDISVPIAFMTP